MSDRTDKAHKALADALVAFEDVDHSSPWERVRFLMDVAAVQAGIARAEALESIAAGVGLTPYTSLGPGPAVGPYTYVQPATYSKHEGPGL